MKKRLLAIGLVLALSIFLAPGKSEAFLNNWYIDLDGSATEYDPTLINEFLDIVGPAYVLNDLSGPGGLSGTFEEWGAFEATGHDGNEKFNGFGDYELTAIFTATGDIELPSDPLGSGTLTFKTGYLEIWADDNLNYTSTDAIYGANDGTRIAKLSLLTGSGSVNASGVPNGQITTLWEFTDIATGYWSYPAGTDLADLDPIEILLGYGTTNASYVANPSANVVNEIAGQYGGQTIVVNDDPPPYATSPPNSPPGDLFVSANGQFRLNVPEPGSMLLVGTALLGLAAVARRFKK